jgi:hypothetical protein
MGENSESKNHSSGCFKNLKEPLGFMKEWVVVWMAKFLENHDYIPELGV